MSLWSVVTFIAIVAVLAVPIIYLISYSGSSAFFKAKTNYNKDLFRRLEKRSDDDGEAQD